MSDFTTSGAQDGDYDANDAPGEPPAPASMITTPGLISSSSAPAGSRTSHAWAETTDPASPQPPTAPEDVVTPTVELTAEERRVLGALVEKSFLTPDTYPMTTNALVSACNQKTNRDPVVDYSAVLIDGTLMELRQRNLVRRVHSQGARSTKHRQTLDEALSLSERQLALLSVLLLRGPQTIGELRLRTERHDVGFDDLEAVESSLEALSSRSTPLVVQLARQPGHKENRWKQLLSAPGSDDQASDQDAARIVHPSAEATSEPVVAPSDGALIARVSELEAQVQMLRRQLSTLADKLGEPLE